MMTRTSVTVALFAILSVTLLVSAGAPGDPALEGTQYIIDADALAGADPEEGPAFREMDIRLAAAHSRIGLRMEAARDLAQGRITLDQAAARFKDLNAAQPAALLVLGSQFPGAGEEELVCRQVVGFVSALRRTDSAAKRTLPALEDELARRFPPLAGKPTA